MAFEHLIILADALGKQRAIVETLERCQFAGAGDAVKAAREEYDRRRWSLVKEVEYQIGKGEEKGYNKGVEDERVRKQKELAEVAKEAVEDYRREQIEARRQLHYEDTTREIQDTPDA